MYSGAAGLPFTTKGGKYENFIIGNERLPRLVGCGQTEAGLPSQLRRAEAVRQANDVIVDYVWNTAAPDMTDEQLADIIARWNARIDAGGYDMERQCAQRPIRDR